MISSSWTCHAAVALAALLPMAHGAFVVFEGSSTTVPGFTNDMNIADVGTVIGDGNTLNTGRGSDSIVIQGNGNMIDDGNDASTITILGDSNTLDNADRGNDKIIAIGNNNVLRAGRGNDLIHVLGNGNTIAAERDSDLIVVTGNGNTIGAGRDGDPLVVVRGNGNTVEGKQGVDRITFAGISNTITGDQEIDTFVPAYKNFDSSSMDSATITDYASTEPIDFTDFTCAGTNMYNLGLRANSDPNNLDLVVYADGMSAMDGGVCFNKVIITLNGVTLADVGSGTTITIDNPGCLTFVPSPTFPVCI